MDKALLEGPAREARLGAWQAYALLSLMLDAAPKGSSSAHRFWFTSPPMAMDDCTKALFLRRKGFILFERGRLVDAYVAYQRSLTLDPGSEVARNETISLVAALKRAGQSDAPALRAVIPPIQTVVGTGCR